MRLGELANRLYCAKSGGVARCARACAGVTFEYRGSRSAMWCDRVAVVGRLSHRDPGRLDLVAPPGHQEFSGALKTLIPAPRSLDLDGLQGGTNDRYAPVSC